MEDPLLAWARVELDNIPNSQEVEKPSSQFHPKQIWPHFILTPISPLTLIAPNTWGCPSDHRIKGSPVLSHFIYKINVGKSRIQHKRLGI